MLQRRSSITGALIRGALAVALAVLAGPVARADTVLITGANTGIGLEFARQYAAQGWSVIVTHRRPTTPASLSELAARYPGKVRIEHLDVTSTSEVHNLAGRLAGVPVDFGLVEQLRSASGKWVSISSEVSITRNDDGRIEFRRKMPTQFDPLEIRLKLPRRAGQVTFDGKKINSRDLYRKT